MRIIEENTGIVRINVAGTLPDGALRQVAYQRYLAFIDRVAAADIIDPEKAYEFYKTETLDMRLSDIKRLYVASQGLYLSDSGGRKVVDRMADLSLEGKDATFSGTDRPEWYDGMVCVEAERENYYLETGDMSNQVGVGEEVTVTPLEILGMAGIEVKNDEGSSGSVSAGANRISIVIGAAGDTGDRFTYSIYLKRDADRVYFRAGGSPSEYIHVDLDTLSATSVNLVDKTLVSSRVEHIRGDVYYAEWVLECTADDVEISRADIAVRDSGGRMGFAGYQIEKGSYATLRIPTSGSPVTRLAPTVTIEDALPETGYIAGWVDTVHLEGVSPYIFENTTGGTGHNILQPSGSSENVIQIRISSSSLIQFNVPTILGGFGGRKSFGFLIAYNSSKEVCAAFMNEDDEFHYEETTHDGGAEVEPDIVLGARKNGSLHTSCRYTAIENGDKDSFTESEALELLNRIKP